MSYKDLVIQYFREVLEEGNMDVIDEIVHPDYSSETYYGDPSNFGPGTENLKKRLGQWTDTFSEKFLLTQIMENDEAVFCEYKVTTQQKKSWFGKIPKDKTAKVDGFILFKFRLNKIFKIKDIFDYSDFWSQLGYLVDAGEYQLPAHLITKESDKVELNLSEIEKLESDYSMLQSSADQYKDLLQYTNYVKNFLKISDKAIRAITISSVIDWQEEFNRHQSDLTGSLPQELLMNTVWILERGKQKVKDLLMFESDVGKLDELFNNLIDFFAKEFSK
ncbi:MAG: ester cyclase [Candidatus Heimdallarchaeota archaeon]|nr:ester cyclase [Candidatus Heimdallarchaeota archaeon]